VIVLDTHAWIWWLNNPDQLSDTARETIDVAAQGDGFVVSSISVWEVAMLVSKGRLHLSMGVADWIAHSEGLPFIHFEPVNNRIALASVVLDMHSDPADRLIVATALYLAADLVSKDSKLAAIKKVTTIW
jgi:PIN domain nuclease of toxin-antitoxin system